MICNLLTSQTLKPAQRLLLLAMALLAASVTLQAQTYTVLHNFTGGGDGGNPFSGLTMDRAGNLYGTTSGYYETGANGNVFKLKKVGSSYILSNVYSFQGGNDGANPLFTPIVFASDGTIYGSTYQGGGTGCGGPGCGTLFHLHPRPNACASVMCPFEETVLYRFTGGADGDYPVGPLTFDSTGVIYGTANRGAVNNCGGGSGAGCGTVFTLTPSGGGGYTFNVIWTFGNVDQGHPYGGVTFDSTGDLFGTAAGCTGGDGDIYELVKTGSNWNENIITGSDGGACPLTGLIFGSDGNFYGGTGLSAGSVFQVSNSGGTWMASAIFEFPSMQGLCGPEARLMRDSAGNLYGTTVCDGANSLGSVFKLTPSGGGYTYTDLHDFAGSDGAMPYSNVVMDSQGNLFGTTVQGGTGTACTGGCGVVWEISPN